RLAPPRGGKPSTPFPPAGADGARPSLRSGRGPPQGAVGGPPLPRRAVSRAPGGPGFFPRLGLRGGARALQVYLTKRSGPTLFYRPATSLPSASPANPATPPPPTPPPSRSSAPDRARRGWSGGREAPCRRRQAP